MSSCELRCSSYEWRAIGHRVNQKSLIMQQYVAVMQKISKHNSADVSEETKTRCVIFLFFFFLFFIIFCLVTLSFQLTC